MTHLNDPDHHWVDTHTALALKRHTQIAVAKLIDDTIRNSRTDSSNTQLKDWFERGISNINASFGYGAQEALDLLKQGKVLMSRELFCGSLDDVSVEWDPCLRQKEKAIGITSGKGANVSIWLEPQLMGRFAVDSATTLLAFTTTLLHELCHAMLSRYSCENACLDPSCRSHREDDFGPCGHGFAWRTIRTSVEDVWEERVGFEIDIQ